MVSNAGGSESWDIRVDYEAMHDSWIHVNSSIASASHSSTCLLVFLLVFNRDSNIKVVRTENIGKYGSIDKRS